MMEFLSVVFRLDKQQMSKVSRTVGRTVELTLEGRLLLLAAGRSFVLGCKTESESQGK